MSIIWQSNSGEALKRPSPKNTGGRIVEFGCSGGRNSINPVKAIVSGPANNDDAVFEVVLEDLPSNPWHQVTAITDAHRHILPNVRFLCAGASFYEPVCAPKPVDLAYSYVAVHFLSDAPTLADHLIYHESQDSVTKKVWADQAADDWERLLVRRAEEMKPGGKLLLSSMGRCDDDNYSWKFFSGTLWEAMHKCLPEVSYTHVSSNMLCSSGMLMLDVRCGAGLFQILSVDEVAALRIPTSLRNEAEILAPFQANGTLHTEFSVEKLEFAFKEVEGETSAPDLASLYRRRIEAVWGSVLVSQLTANGRSEQDATEAMTKVWDEYEKMAEKDPSLGWLFMQSYYLQLTKL